MKKRFKKIFKVTLLSLLAAFVTIAVVILFPQKLFANKLKYKSFTVCSNNIIDNNIKIVLDNAMSLVQRSELYDSGYDYNIILCYNSLYNKIDDKLPGPGSAARARLHNVIIKVRIDSKDNLAFPTFPRACEINLDYLIAHEMIHCLQAHKYGIFKFNPFSHPEYWKLEGYPEYISKQKESSGTAYDLTAEIDRYQNLKSHSKNNWVLSEESGCEVPDYYYKGWLMMKYLIDIKHLSYHQILKDTSSENIIYQEMIDWSKRSKGHKN